MTKAFVKIFDVELEDVELEDGGMTCCGNKILSLKG